MGHGLGFYGNKNNYTTTFCQQDKKHIYRKQTYKHIKNTFMDLPYLDFWVLKNVKLTKFCNFSSLNYQSTTDDLISSIKYLI